MTNPSNTPDRDEQESKTNSISTRASWAGSVASGEPAPGVAGAGLRQGAQVRQAAAEGGPQPEGGDVLACCDSSRTRADTRARQRPRQPRQTKRLHQPNTRFNDDEFALVTSAAAECELSVAGFLARSALAAARDLQRTAAEIADERDVITALFESRRRLGWAGSNLNQAMKAVNSGSEAPQLPQAIDAVKAAADRVHEAASALLRQQNSP